MRYRVCNPTGASVYRRIGNRLVKTEDRNVECDQFVETTEVIFDNSDNGYFLELVPRIQQDTLDQHDEYFVFSGDLDITPPVFGT